MDLFKEKWSVSRQIINYVDDSFSGTASGGAVFYKQENNSSLLHENVMTNWENGTSSIATKSYLFMTESNGENDCIFSIYHFKSPISLQENKQLTQIELSEKILMHKFDNIMFNFGSCYKSLYICGMDKYKLSFTILSADSFSMDYKIKGPRKNCYIKSIYEKV